MKDSYSIASIDVCIGLEVLQNLFQVASSGSSKEAGIVIRLEKKRNMIAYIQERPTRIVLGLLSNITKG